MCLGESNMAAGYIEFDGTYCAEQESIFAHADPFSPGAVPLRATCVC